MAADRSALTGHRVHVYDDVSVVARSIAAFLRDAIVRGGAAIAIARPDLIAAIEDELRGHGLDVAELARNGRLTCADAEHELAQFLDGDQPDRARFSTRMNAHLDAARASAPSELVHAYGEMVDVLWARGLASQVIELERLWTELGRARAFVLTCGYRIDGTRDLGALPAFCALHDRVGAGDDDPASDVSQIVVMLQHRARSLETEITRREIAEQRMLELLAVTSELAGATTEEAVARIVVEAGASAVAAATAALWRCERAELRLVRDTLRDRELMQRYTHVPLALDAPVAVVARTGEPVFLGDVEEFRARFPASHARIASTIHGELAQALLPVACGGDMLGVLCFTYDRKREFDDTGRAFKALLARQCALAFERIAARGEIELVYGLVAGANATDDLEAVHELALDAVVRGSRSDRAAVLLFDPDGVMRFKASRGLSATYRAAVEGHSPWQRETRDPEPITVDDTEADPAWASYRDVFRAEGIRALAFVPLVHHHRLVGKLMLYRDEPRAFSTREIQLTATMAVHVAQAVERKRAARELEHAYAEERQAHVLADEATRAREEILSVVSHDLRNPLGAIAMSASSLKVLDVAEPARQRVRTTAERLARQADRMARMIDDLVDFAGIQAGRLALTRGEHSPHAIIAAARELFGPLAHERGLAFEAGAAVELPAIECDDERALQVIGNLVANALKVTPRGGVIAIGAEACAADTVFFVRDTGPGIAPTDLPNLFERFWRAKNAPYRGAGLGLSIARGIVDAHGGRIWAESQLGAGSTFYFSLSRLQPVTAGV
jgi:signal transduction histidine kinase